MRTATTHRLPRTLMIAAALLTACGTAVDSEHQGPPLATVTGQITSNGQIDVGDGLKLALVWYPSLSGSGAKGLVTEDVVYRGNFPLQYSFDIYKPPPQSAIADWSAFGGPRRAAVGLLIAYSDLNRNGTLDTIKADGVVHDKVLGASVGFGEDVGYFLLYIDGQYSGTEGPLGMQGLRQGFNLVNGETVVPIGTPIPMALFDVPESNLLICEQLYSIEEPSQVPGDHICGIPLMPSTYVGGGISLIDDTLRLNLEVGGEAATGSVVVKLNQRQLPPGVLENDELKFVLEEPNNGFLVPGSVYDLEVIREGTTIHRSRVRMPGDFAVTAPSAGASIPVKGTLTATWTRSTGANGYEFDLTGPNGLRHLEQVDGLTFTTDTGATAGDATVQISAYVWPEGGDQVLVAKLGKRVQVKFAE